MLILPSNSYLIQCLFNILFPLIFSLFTYLCLTAPGPRCCVWAFFSCSSWSLLLRGLSLAVASPGDSLGAEYGPLLAGASLVSEHRLYGAWSSMVTSHGLRRCGSWATEPRFNRCGARTSLLHSNECGIFLDQRSTRVSCIGRWILYHWP